MLEDRFYMRDEPVRRNYSAAMILLWVNLGIFILQEINRTYIHSPVERLFMLSPGGIASGYLWQIVTFQFLHGGPLHLACNLLALFFFGRAVEDMIGTRRFLQAYFLAGTVGGIFQVLLGFLFGGSFAIPVVGASAGLFGITAVFGTIAPEAMVNFMFIPMKARFLVVVSALIAGFYILVPSPSTWGIAHAAHFGGIGAGVAFVKWFMNNDWRFPKFQFRKPAPRPRELVNAPGGAFWKKSKPTIVEEEPLPTGDFITKEVDPILDKISAHGMQSLTEREKRILEAARAKMAKR